MSGYYFCPACGNLLLIDTAPSPVQLQCRSCNLKMDFQQEKRRKAELTQLDVKSFVVSDDAMNFQNKTTVKCEKCGHDEAFFTEIQIRSADEPSTIFYCCCKCKYRWREG